MKNLVKVPVIMQMEALECGAASLAMVLAYHGKWLPLEQVRVDCGVSRDGASAKNLLRAARLYGLQAKGYRVEPKDLIEAKFPCIIHWNFNHFVVLNGFKKDKAVINDPASGTVEVDLEEFNKSFTGIVLKFEKTENFQAGGKPESIVAFLKGRVKNSMKSFYFIMLTGVVSAFIGIITPIFLRIFMDQIITGKHPEWLPSFITIMSFTLIVQLFIGSIQGIYWLKIQGKLAIEANANFMWHILRLPIEFFSQRFAGDIANRQNSNELIAQTLIEKLAPILMNCVLLIVYLVIMMNYSVVLSLVGIVSVIINVYTLQRISKMRLDMSRVLQRDYGKLLSVTVSGFHMIESIKASGAENGFFEKWAGYFAKQSNSQIEFNKATQTYGVIPQLLQQIANTLVLMLGVYLVLSGDLTIGMLIAFQGFLAAFLLPVNELAAVGQSFIEMRSSMERVQDVLKYKTDSLISKVPIDFEADKLNKLSGNIEIKDLSFGYSKLNDPLIDKFSLNLKKGESVAFVGGSGSGKSTLAKIIAGLYEAWDGEVLFDYKKKQEIPHEIFTSSLSVVDQDITLFEDTIFQNITMWDESIDKSIVVNACKDAQIHEDIMRRPGGYEHMIREGGKNFSGGQKQRLEIARALVMNPSVLILDEATSALDTLTEFKLMEAIKRRNITLIIVAHRLSTIRDCNEIIVLDKGKVSERGTHDSLIDVNGAYAQLINN